MLKLTKEASTVKWSQVGSVWFLESSIQVLASATNYHYRIFRALGLGHIDAWLPEGSKANAELNKQLAEAKLRELGIIE